MRRTTLRIKRKAVWGSGLVWGVLLSAVAFSGCGQADQGRGPVTLVLDTLQGASGADPEKFGDVLQSDVLTFVKSGDVRVPSVFPDLGKVTFHLRMKDPAASTSPANAITVSRYHVTFIRSDGRNTPGVDVPYGFDGAATATITEQGVVTFTIVPLSAKLEAPLKALTGLGGSVVISTIAQITFYGTDAAGNTVSVTGQMSVSFADWGDPE